MAKSDNKPFIDESLSGTYRDDRSESDKSDRGSDERTAIKSRNYFMPITLAVCVVLALTLTVVLFQDQSDQTNVAQKPIDHAGRQTAAGSETRPVLDINRQAKSQLPTKPSAQQQIAPAAQVNITNDVKKTKTEKREQLVTTSALPKDITLDSTQDSSRRALQTPNEIPVHVRELLQKNSNASDQKLDAMPADAILKSWQKSQWIEQVKALTKQGNHQLAEDYVNVYPDYFPNDSIRDLLAR